MSLRSIAVLALLAGCSSGGTSDNPDGDSGDDAGGSGTDSSAGGGDMAGQPPADMTGAGNADLTTTLPAGGNVGAKGGTVDRLYFAIHGDTRPASCNDTANYPTAIIDSIYSREAAAGVEFSLDL